MRYWVTDQPGGFRVGTRGEIGGAHRQAAQVDARNIECFRQQEPGIPANPPDIGPLLVVALFDVGILPERRVELENSQLAGGDEAAAASYARQTKSVSGLRQTVR